MWHKPSLLWMGAHGDKGPEESQLPDRYFPQHRRRPLGSTGQQGRSVAAGNGTGCLRGTCVNRALKLLGHGVGGIVAEGKHLHQEHGASSTRGINPEVLKMPAQASEPAER